MTNFYGQYVGFGAGGVAGWVWQGENYGYCYSRGPAPDSRVDQYSFVSDSPATDVGDVSVMRRTYTSGTSETHGYCAGGDPIGSSNYKLIDKFAFAVSPGFTMTTVGNLWHDNNYACGSSSLTHGYTSGSASPAVSNVIDKYSFSADSPGSDVGNLLGGARGGGSGHNEHVSGYGYHAGGGPVGITKIDRYAYASDGDSTDWADLHSSTNQNQGCSSLTDAYSVGNYNIGGPASYWNDEIMKFNFAAGGTGTQPSVLTSICYGPSSSSSTTFGYRAGGNITGWGGQLRIDKFAFASDTDAEIVGDLTLIGDYMGSGSQY